MEWDGPIEEWHAYTRRGGPPSRLVVVAGRYCHVHAPFAESLRRQAIFDHAVALGLTLCDCARAIEILFGEAPCTDPLVRMCAQAAGLYVPPCELEVELEPAAAAAGKLALEAMALGGVPPALRGQPVGERLPAWALVARALAYHDCAAELGAAFGEEPRLLEDAPHLLMVACREGALGVAALLVDSVLPGEVLWAAEAAAHRNQREVLLGVIPWWAASQCLPHAALSLGNHSAFHALHKRLCEEGDGDSLEEARSQLVEWLHENSPATEKDALEFHPSHHLLLEFARAVVHLL
jgi:hypothetical protein